MDSTNGRLYVCNFGSNSLAVFNASTLALLETVATGASPNSVAYYAPTNRIYQTQFNGLAGGLSVYDASTSPPTPISGSPFAANTQFIEVVVGP